MTLSPDVLQRIELPRTYVDGLNHATTGELAIRSRVSRLNYSWRCAEASPAQAHMKQGLPLAPGMEIGSVKDAKNLEVGPARTASEFDAAYYRGLLEKARGEVECSETVLVGLIMINLVFLSNKSEQQKIE